MYCFYLFKRVKILFHIGTTMEFEVIFCADGILRIKLGNEPMIPAKFIYDSYDYKSDLSFWARWWEGYTYFEQGLTVGQFLRCLEPWSEFWTDLTHKNIQAFIDESRKLTLVKNEENSENEHPLSWVSLSYHIEIDLESQYEKDNFDTDDINEWFNRPQNVKLTGNWNIHGSYKLTGYSQGYNEQYSIDYSPMNELAGLPLVLSDKQILVASDFSAKRILGTDYELFKPESFGVRTLAHGDSGYKTIYLQGQKQHRLREMIEGFFWWFPSNPTSREEFNESLKLSVDELKHLDNEAHKDESNVIALFKEPDVFEAANDTIEDPKKLKIVVADGAFAPIIKQMDRDSKFWEELLEKAKKDNDVVIKIGELKKAHDLENRIYSYIVPEEDISTPYTKI